MKKLLITFAALAMAVACSDNSCPYEAQIAELDSLIAVQNIPQMEISVYENGKTFTYSGGMDTLNHFYGNDNCTFQAASLSKVVFSYLVMKAVDDGLIELDKPLCEYTDIDRFEDKEMASRLTARIVLSHRTGLPNWAASPSSDEWPTSIIRFKYPVDSCYAYSGEGIAFLQRALEQIKGKSLEEIAREEVFAPFGMNLTSYDWLPAYDSLCVCSFNLEGENRGQRYGLRPNSAYTLRTCSKEYMEFIRRALIKGEGLQPETYKEWLTAQTEAIRYAGNHRDADAGFFWGLGVGLKDNGEGKCDICWHWGDNGTFKALFVASPEAGKAVMYLTNNPNGHHFANRVCELFMGKNYGIQEWIEEE